MKNTIKIIIVLIVICLMITGCDGTVTRSIRKDGYNIQSNRFKCGFFINNSKDETTVEKIKFLTSNYIISEKGNIYEYSLSGFYSNGMNCKKGGNLGTKVVAIMDQDIIKGSDGRYYYLNSENYAASYSKVTTADKNYQKYKLLMDDKNYNNTKAVKVITVNSSINSYYVLTQDGNIINVTLSQDDGSDNYRISNSVVDVSNNTYGPIVDFNYAGDNVATFYRTSDSIYNMKITNAKECNKYIDTPCQFELQKDTMLMDHIDRIIAYNGQTIITDYGRVFSAGS